MPALPMLKKRKDFVYISKSGISFPAKTIVFQAAKNRLPSSRIGFTASKKLGNAVTRNRCRRRLKAVAALYFNELALPGADYVLIGRYSTAKADFSKICDDFKYGMKKVNQHLNGETDDTKDCPVPLPIVD